MNKYSVKATTSSPSINFDPEVMSFEIKGESYPENCWAFYSPMFDWLKTYFDSINGIPVEIDMEIIYFNSSSSKTFMDFFEMLDDQAERGKNIVVNWRYHEENESAMECGEEFMEDVERIKFNLVEFTGKEAMDAKQVKSSLRTLIPLKQPVFIWGSPGVGKSQVVGQVAQELGRELTDIRAVLLDPVDLRGLPSVKGDIARWCPPAFLPTEGEGILFPDELNAAPPLVQAACYQLVLDRKVGEYSLPDGWTVVAAGNNETDRAVTHRMPSALANRFVHLDFSVDVETWLEWAEETGISEEVLAFIRFRPKLLHDFDPKKNAKAFPSPRSWEFAARILASTPDPDVELSLLKGTIGPGAAVEFAGFSRMFRQLPDPDAVINHPTTAVIPEEPATLYALCEALAKRAGEETAEGIVTYATRLPSEFGVLLVRDAVKNHRDVVETPAFSHWTTANADVLL